MMMVVGTVLNIVRDMEVGIAPRLASDAVAVIHVRIEDFKTVF